MDLDRAPNDPRQSSGNSSLFCVATPLPRNARIACNCGECRVAPLAQQHETGAGRLANLRRRRGA
jgi:hypothetical protein